MKKIFNFIKVIAIITFILLALGIVGKQDMEYAHQRAKLAGYSADK